MSNEEILNQRWKTTDKTLKDYLKRFRSISTETLDKLVEVFDTLDITYSDLNKPISKEEKRKLDRKIKEWKKQGLLTGYFAYLISKKSKYTYSDLLEILVYGVYVEQEEKIKSTSQEVFTIVAKDVYSQALKEIPVKPKKKFSLTWEFIWSLLWIPTYNKSWDNYIQLLTMNNYQEAYKQIVQVIQQGKDLNDSMLKDLMKKQCNRILSINDDKYSGVLSDTCISLGNKVYTEPFKDEEDLQVRFIAVIDSRTTKMCSGMNNMLFYVNKTNKFYRYSDYDGRDVYYECKGLVGGINLPPILNHFHWCRSTITYQLETSVADMVRDNIKVANEYDKEQYSRYKKYFGDEVPDNVEDFTKMKYNNTEKWENLKSRYYIEKRRYEIKNDIVNTKIRDKQLQHILGEKQYKEGNSYFNLPKDEVYELLKEKKGTGRLFKDNNDEYKEVIVNDKVIGHFIHKNKENEIVEDIETDTFIILYSNKGIHAYPIKSRGEKNE